MAQNPHEYLIEQLQFTGDESVGSSSNKIKLNFNHPCKELVWVVQPDENVDYCASLERDTMLYKTLGAQPFNYTDAVDALPNSIMAFGGESATSANTTSFINASGLFQDAGAVDVTANTEGFYTEASAGERYDASYIETIAADMSTDDTGAMNQLLATLFAEVLQTFANTAVDSAVKFALQAQIHSWPFKHFSWFGR